MIDLVLMYGRTDQDKHVLGRREALNVLEALSNEVRVLKKIVDKGGIVVVAEGDALITTYNCDQQFRVDSRSL
jgi:hypothetical protein